LMLCPDRAQHRRTRHEYPPRYERSHRKVDRRSQTPVSDHEQGRRARPGPSTCPADALVPAPDPCAADDLASHSTRHQRRSFRAYLPARGDFYATHTVVRTREGKGPRRVERVDARTRRRRPCRRDLEQPDTPAAPTCGRACESDGHRGAWWLRDGRGQRRRAARGRLCRTAAGYSLRALVGASSGRCRARGGRGATCKTCEAGQVGAGQGQGGRQAEEGAMPPYGYRRTLQAVLHSYPPSPKRLRLPPLSLSMVCLARCAHSQVATRLVGSDGCTAAGDGD
jgi:hypothetical protein